MPSASTSPSRPGSSSPAPTSRSNTLFRRLRGAAPERVWRIEVQPGEKAQVDFGTGAWVIDPVTGVRRRPWVLRVGLSFSRKAYSGRRLTDQRAFLRDAGGFTLRIRWYSLINFPLA